MSYTITGHQRAISCLKHDVRLIAGVTCGLSARQEITDFNMKMFNLHRFLSGATAVLQPVRANWNGGIVQILINCVPFSLASKERLSHILQRDGGNDTGKAGSRRQKLFDMQ